MCDTCTMIGETYRYGADFDAEAYTRSVSSFWCPICNAGRQRPNVTAGLQFDQWQYECDTCLATGTREQIVNSAFYSARIEPRVCHICGGRIRPYACRMHDDWWMQPSRRWIWKCAECSFVGTLADFKSETAHVTMPDFVAVPTF